MYENALYTVVDWNVCYCHIDIDDNNNVVLIEKNATMVVKQIRSCNDSIAYRCSVWLTHTADAL